MLFVSLMHVTAASCTKLLTYPQPRANIVQCKRESGQTAEPFNGKRLVYAGFMKRHDACSGRLAAPANGKMGGNRQRCDGR